MHILMVCMCVHARAHVHRGVGVAQAWGTPVTCRRGNRGTPYTPRHLTHTPAPARLHPPPTPVSLRPPACLQVVLVEGCEQVLESHLIVALSAATKHLILTGDKTMARHGTPVARLAKQFRLDVAMLDRLAHNGVDCANLGYQRRTRPQIARLLSPIYESLPDRAPPDGWPSVRGIERACFFLKHEKAGGYTVE